MPSLKIRRLLGAWIGVVVAAPILVAVILYWRIHPNSDGLPEADDKPDSAFTDEERQAPPVASFCVVKDESEKWGYINRFGFEVIKPQFDAGWDFVADRAIVYSNFRDSVIDATGKVKFVPEKAYTYLKLSGLDGMIWCKESRDHWGLIDEKGRVVLKSTYGDVRQFSEGLAAVNIGATSDAFGGPSGGKWGLINEDGEIIVPIENEAVGSLSEGLALVKNSAGTRFVDKLGKTVFRVDAKYSMSSDFSEGLAPAYEANAESNKPLTTHYFNRLGNIEFSVAGYAKAFQEGLAPFTEHGSQDERNEDRLYGFIDRNGKVAIRPQFAKVDEFDGGLAPVRLATGDPEEKSKWGYIDKTGEIRIKAEFNEALPFHRGLARAHIGGHRADITDVPPTWGGGAWYLIDPTGRKLKKEIDRY